MLNLCRIRHKETYKESFKVHENSQSFVDEMHSILNEMNYGRIEGVLGLNKPMSSENKGFIHVLANDPEVDIWWGHKRDRVITMGNTNVLPLSIKLLLIMFI